MKKTDFETLTASLHEGAAVLRGKKAPSRRFVVEKDGRGAGPSLKWEWREAGDEEFETRRRKETYYKIFRLVGKNRSKPRKATVYKFWAKSRRAALSILKEYSADHPGETFYYSTSGYYTGPDGCRHDDFDDLFSVSGGKREKDKLAEARRKFADERKRLHESIRTFFRSLKPKDAHLRGMVDDFRFFARNYDTLSGKSHQRREVWNLDNAVLDILDFNLPRLAKRHSGAPNDFCEKARRRLKEARSPDGNVSKKTMELADRLWREEIGKLHLYVRLYRFYAGFCLVDRRNPSESEFFERHKHTIPYLPGTFKELDYAKLAKLEERYWRLWIDQFRKIGRSLWD